MKHWSTAPRLLVGAVAALVAIACSADPGKRAVDAPAHASPAPPEARGPSSCGGPGDDRGPTLPRRAVLPPPQGYDALAPPPGFVRISLAELPALRERDENDALHYLYMEDDPDRIGLWTWDDEATSVVATLETLRHAAESPVVAFDREVLTRFDPFDTPLAPDEAIEARMSWWTWILRWRGAGDRPAIEWALLAKGCEREEIYERFVREGDVIWHVRLRLQPTIDADTLGEWLSLVFDAPLSVLAPEGRRALSTAKTK